MCIIYMSTNRSKRYRGKGLLKYFVVGVFLLFVILVTIADYSEIPQLKPVIDAFGFVNSPLNLAKSSHYYEPTTIENIQTNPENYIEKNVLVEGKLGLDFHFRTTDKGKIDYFLLDDQNFEIAILSPLPYHNERIYTYGDSYRVKGEVIYLQANFPNPRKKEMVLVLDPSEMIKLR